MSLHTTHHAHDWCFTTLCTTSHCVSFHHSEESGWHSGSELQRTGFSKAFSCHQSTQETIARVGNTDNPYLWFPDSSSVGTKDSAMTTLERLAFPSHIYSQSFKMNQSSFGLTFGTLLPELCWDCFSFNQSEWRFFFLCFFPPNDLRFMTKKKGGFAWF